VISQTLCVSWLLYTVNLWSVRHYVCRGFYTRDFNHVIVYWSRHAFLNVNKMLSHSIGYNIKTKSSFVKILHTMLHRYIRMIVSKHEPSRSKTFRAAIKNAPNFIGENTYFLVALFRPFFQIRGRIDLLLTRHYGGAYWFDNKSEVIFL